MGVDDYDIIVTFDDQGIAHCVECPIASGKIDALGNFLQAMGVGVDDLGRRLRRRLPVTVVNCLIVAGGFAVLGVNFREVDRSSVILPDAYGRWLLAELPQDAVLLTDGDDASFSPH